jgi:hypothetical protein
MDEMQRYSVLARLLEQEDPPTVVLPITQTGRRYDSGYYLCSPGCGKRFKDIASKRQHQHWCVRAQQ